MAESTSAVRTVIAAVQLLFGSDNNGQSIVQKAAAFIAAGLLFVLFVFCAFLDSIFSIITVSEDGARIRAEFLQEFSKPVIQTGQQGLLPLPVTIMEVSSYYGHRYIEGMPERSNHEGLDFSVPLGSPVMAVAPGKVVSCGTSRDYGEYIMIEHHMIRLDENDDVIETETFYSLYAHLFKKYVFIGQTVEQGRQIAASGGDTSRHFSGNSTGAHLHIELRRTTEYGSHFDPYDYLLNPHPFRGETKSIEWKTI